MHGMNEIHSLVHSMSTSGDLREALTQRLKRLEQSTASGRLTSITSLSGLPRAGSGLSGTSPTSSGNLPQQKGMFTMYLESKRSASLPGLSQISFSREPSVSPTGGPVVPFVRCEGYLYKYSSGSLTGRWQKRYFVLDKGRFGYYKKPPITEADSSAADKSFSLRKIKEVVWNESAVSDREFSIKLGEGTYQLKASSPSEMRKWVSAINTAIAQKDSLIGLHDDDDNGSSSAVDLASVSNSVSSQASESTIMNEDIQAYLHHQRQMVQASAAARKQETVWEVEVDPDELDRSFSEWFTITDSDDVKQASQKLIKGISIANSHLYSTVSSEVFDAHVLDLPHQLKRARSTVQSLRRGVSTKSEENTQDPIRSQLNSILMEYVSRTINVVVRFLDHRKEVRESANGEGDYIDELLAVIDALSAMMTDLTSLTVTKSDCGCAHCSAAQGISDSCTATERWKKSLRNVMQRVSSELEVTLIERIQGKMMSWEYTWDAEAGSSDSAPNKTSHALFGSRLTVWLTGWSSGLIATCEHEGFSILQDELRVKYCKRLVSELIASVLIAVLNSAWRQFKRKLARSQAFAETRKNTLRQIAHIRENNTGFWSVFSSQHHEIERLEKSVPPEETFTLELQNLAALGNEAILLSTFLSETLPEQLPYVPKIFESCFEGLAGTYANTAIEVASLVVHFHFIEKHTPEMTAAFKTIQGDPKKTPMIVARDATEKFATELVPFGVHPAMKSHIVNLLPSAVIQLYITALLKNKPKVKQIKNLTKIFETDLIIFKSLFSETRFNCKDSVVHRATLPLTVAMAFISEPNKQNIEDEVSRRLVVAFGEKFAVQVANALIEIRGSDYTKSERASLMSRLEPYHNERDAKATVSLSRTETASYLTDAETVWRF